MKIIEQFNIENSNENLFLELSKPEGFKKIMPENLTSFFSSENGFNFTLEGMPTIYLDYSEKIENQKIILKSGNKSTVKFEIKFEFNKKQVNSTDCIIEFKGNLNPFVKMMVEKPLKNLIINFSNNLKKI